MASISSSTPKTPTANGDSKAASSVDDGLDSLLNRQALAVQKEVEIERILKAFKLKCVRLSWF
jgi:hypothetical protein